MSIMPASDFWLFIPENERTHLTVLTFKHMIFTQRKSRDASALNIAYDNWLEHERVCRHAHTIGGLLGHLFARMTGFNP